MTAARKLGVQASIDKALLLEFKELKATSTRWKEEARFDLTATDVRLDSPAPAQTGSTSALAHQAVTSTKGARDDTRGTALNAKPDDPDVVLNDTPCDRCATAGSPCWGAPGRVCEGCKLVQKRCTRSSGRGGARMKRKRLADEDAEQAPEGACARLRFKLVLLTTL